ncbi:MAG: tRNA (guanosine(46)-N7)-methyltransferase TrmB [Alphaproteobacteria bacterium]|nr:tRNA (guanosine(46)-N7)-methyltransferase TrmB [Alphaproteobacteria bacterium]
MKAVGLIQSFGRKRARGLSTTQKNNLDSLAEKFGISLADTNLDPHSIFDNRFSSIFVEIGFGGGEHLIQNSILHQNIGFIGCEPFENGVANTYKNISNNNLLNVRIFKGDARLLLNQFKNDTIKRFYVLFPDPWPKKKHHKRRLLSVDFLKLLQKKATSDGELVIATDSEDYMLNILENLKIAKICDDITDLSQLSNKPKWFLETRYEQKALQQGKQCYYIKLQLNKIA